MPEPGDDVYVAAFAARCAPAEGAGGQRVDGPGICGVLCVDGSAPTQLLVVDDRAVDALAALLPMAGSGTVRVYAGATRCARLVAADGRWHGKAVTAMVCPDLRTVPRPELPDGLWLRSVRRTEQDPVDGVPLRDAVEAAGRAEPLGDVTEDALVSYLASLSDGARIFAAVDGDGVVRATSGSRTAQAEAYAFFVSTDPAWRRRGVGRSMTATALHAAAGSGATRASLDASGAGVPLYRQLGFTAVAELTQWSAGG